MKPQDIIKAVAFSLLLVGCKTEPKQLPNVVIMIKKSFDGINWYPDDVVLQQKTNIYPVLYISMPLIFVTNQFKLAEQP